MTAESFTLGWCDESAEVLVRGHVDLETYREALVTEGCEPDRASGVTHGYGRWIPRRQGYHGYDRWFETCDGPARGAMPFTIRSEAMKP